MIPWAVVEGRRETNEMREPMRFFVGSCNQSSEENTNFMSVF
jgi:hypothetical protein